MTRFTPWMMLVVSTVYLVAASPFIFGVSRPSIHEGHYAALFVILNYPALLVASRPLGWLESLFPKMTSRTSGLMALASCLLFWLVLALLVGLLIDRHRRQRQLGRDAAGGGRVQSVWGAVAPLKNKNKG